MSASEQRGPVRVSGFQRWQVVKKLSGPANWPLQVLGRPLEHLQWGTAGGCQGGLFWVSPQAVLTVGWREGRLREAVLSSCWVWGSSWWWHLSGRCLWVPRCEKQVGRVLGVQTLTDLSRPLGFHSRWINCNRLWVRESWNYGKIGICHCPTLVFCPRLPPARSTHQLRYTHNTPSTHILNLLYKSTQHSLIYLYTILNTLDQIFMPKPHDTYRFVLETFVCKVFVCGLWHQPFCIYLHLVYSSHAR